MGGVAPSREELDREAETQALEAEMGELCGVINAATGRLVRLVARVLETGCYEGVGIRSPEQWVAWRCGVSPSRARGLVAMARRVAELPATQAAFEAGELAEDQVRAIAAHAPAANDAEVAELARSATVVQLRRVLSACTFDATAQPEAEAEPEARRRVRSSFDEDGWWRLSALLPPDEGALVERALGAAWDAVAGPKDGEAGQTPARVSWADALVEVAERSLAAGDGATEPDRHLVLVHVDAATRRGRLHLGPALPDALRRQLTCDGRARAVVESAGVALSVGRRTRIVAPATRAVLEERDRGCRVPGCGATRGLQVHHVVHWEDGGSTDTANLCCLCRRHHRLHHLGTLGITGDADHRDGLVFTDEWGRRLTGNGRPAPPAPGPLEPMGQWIPPTGERLDPHWVTFSSAGASG